MDEFQKEMFDIFVFETNTFLEQLETILMQAENQDGDILDAVPEVFRIMHTIKSSSAMMGFSNISKLAHSMEDLFFYLREHKPTQVDKKRLTDIVLFGVDYIKRNMADPEEEEDATDAIQEVSGYLKLLSGSAAEQSAANQGGADNAVPDHAESSGPSIRVRFKPNCVMIGLRAFEIIHKASLLQNDLVATPGEDDPEAETVLQQDGLVLALPSSDHLEEILAQVKASPFVSGAALVGEDAGASPDAAAPAPPAETGPPPMRRRRDDFFPNSSNYLGIEVKKLDKLINLAGEMIIASMGSSHAFDQGDEELTHRALEDLHHLILEMQDRVLSLRMVSVKDMFHKLSRSVRDAETRLQKEIHFTTSGEDTALDRNVIDQVFSPLMHILRNAVDHGIEPEYERLAAGKPSAGQVHLSAAIEGDLAVLRVQDDGKGIDKNAVLAKALASGLVRKDQVPDMSDEEILALLFLPGFSTREQVTELSGRGVGMDVVHESVRKLNGRVTISSVLGQGTRMELRIPLTLTILDAMIMKAAGEVCAIPISSVREAFRPEEGSIREANGQDMVLHRGQCYQIVRLSDLYQAPNPSYMDGLMLVLESGGEQYALFIDDVVGQQSIVVKPIPPLLKGIPGIYGCTIRGDGKVCLIIDVDGLLKSMVKR